MALNPNDPLKSSVKIVKPSSTVQKVLGLDGEFKFVYPLGFSSQISNPLGAARKTTSFAAGFTIEKLIYSTISYQVNPQGSISRGVYDADIKVKPSPVSFISHFVPESSLHHKAAPSASIYITNNLEASITRLIPSASIISGLSPLGSLFKNYSPLGVLTNVFYTPVTALDEGFLWLDDGGRLEIGY